MRNVVLLLPLIWPLWLGATPLPYAATYKVEIDGVDVGILERRLERIGEHQWRQSTTMYATGWVAMIRKDRFEEESLWQWQANSLIPRYYRYRHTEKGKLKVDEEVEFSSNQVRLRRNQHQQQITIDTTTYDRLSYQIPLQNAVANGVTEIAFQVAERDSLRDYAFKVTGGANLHTPLGNLETLQVQRQGSGDRITHIWLAPSLHYSPVRLEQEHNGHIYRSTLLKIEFSALPL
jgi:hypothetical protein